MVEHRFYCGCDPPAKLPKNSRHLRVHGPDRNIELDPLPLSRWLATTIPPRLCDLMDIAAYVFAADRITRRGGPTGKEMGVEWRRNLQFKIAVRDPAHWSQPELLTTMRELLGFMTEDEFGFVFTRLQENPPVQDYLALQDAHRSGEAIAPVILFSGGLDSLAGALDELSKDRKRVVLVTHLSSDYMAGHQNDLAEALREKYGDRIIYLPVRMTLTNGLEPAESTQRSRTFFFSAIAATVAALLGAPGIRYYENGIMSLNLPISEEVVGTSATRSTHPRVLAEMVLFLEVATAIPCTVDNPFIFKTKAEVLKVIEQHGNLDLIGRTVSCTEVRKRVKGCTHCGACVQCLHRRFGVLAAYLGAHDSPGQYAKDLFADPRVGNDRTMLVDLVRSARAYSKMSAMAFLQAYPGELSRLSGVPGHGTTETLVQHMHQLHQRHGGQFERVIEDGIQKHKEALSKGLMPPGSLLTFVVGEQIGQSSRVKTAWLSLPHSDSTITLTVDVTRQVYSVNGSDVIRGAKSVAVLVLLAEQHRKDRNADRKADDFKYLSTRQLAFALKVDEDAVRRRIERIRGKIAGALATVGVAFADRHIAIESKTWDGFRLNPNIRLVAPD